MDRRSFLRGSAIAVAGVPAVAAPAVAAVLKPGGIRVSTDKDDPGYRAWCEANGDGKTVAVYLDGVEQKCVTADEAEGLVCRPVVTASGNLARSHDEILMETVYGDVQIVIG